jgi:signal transduction histidine kinase
MDYPILNSILSSKKSCYVEETASEPAWRDFCGKTDTRSWLGVPILGGEQVIGICGLENCLPQAFHKQQITLAETLTSQAAIAMHNAWLFDQVRTGRERLRALSRRLVDTQEKERRYIARELHDQTSQALIYLKVVLELLKSDAHDPEKVLGGVAEIDKITGEVLDGLHRLSADIRPASLDLLGLTPALRQYTENLTGKYGLQVNLDVASLDTRLPADVEISLYRIIQEALSNTVRHAKATRADVLIIKQPGKILAQINDDGIGFDWNEALYKGRLGLFGMRERAEMLGGLLKVNTASGCGTQLTIEIPYAANPDSYRR